MPKFSEQIVDDSGYQRPVEGALVFLLDRDGNEADTDSPNPTWTDNFGVFSFIADDGVYRFSARMGGVEIARGDALIGVPPEFRGPQGEGLEDVMAPGGSALVGFTQEGGEARTVQDKARENLSILDFRFAADIDDTAAFNRAQIAVANAGAGIIHFPAGQGKGTDGAYRVSGSLWGLAITASYMTLQGDGMDATVIERLDGDGAVIGGPGSVAYSVRIEHMTLKARGGGWCFHANFGFTYNDWIWTNVRLSGRKDIRSQNLFQMIGDNGGSASDWTFNDCIAQTCSRMGFEFQNHRDDYTPGDRSSAFLSISFTRCSIVDIQAAPGIYSPGGSSPFGMSFSGYCSDINLFEMYFAGVQGALVELIGAQDVSIRNFEFFAPTIRPHPDGDYADDALIRASGNRKMFNLSIDGMYPVTQANSSIDALRPEIMRMPLRLDNIEAVTLNRLYLVRVTREKVMELGVNTPLMRARLSNSILGSFRYVVSIDGGSLDVTDTTLITYSSTPNDANGVRAWNNSGPCDVTMRNVRTEFNNGGPALQLIGGATGYVVTRAAPPAVSYTAPTGGTTIDAEGRTSLGQVAADVEGIRAALRAAGLMRPA